MKCPDCNISSDIGNRYCPQCGAYLSVQPGKAHRHLLQLSPDDFLTVVAAGLPLICENSSRLWAEAREVSHLGNRHATGILESIAEEEAAKALILFDAVRCPGSYKDKFIRLVKQVDQHIGKGVYAYYYNTAPGDLTEVKRIVDYARQEFSREGEYGEFIRPNSILTNRESRQYVSYIQDDDETYSWHAPINPPLCFGRLSKSFAIQTIEALNATGTFEIEALRTVREYWQEIHFDDIGSDPTFVDLRNSIVWRRLVDLNFGMLASLDSRKLLLPTTTQEQHETIACRLLFPLYSFDLSITKNFRELPPPDDPYDY